MFIEGEIKERKKAHATRNEHSEFFTTYSYVPRTRERKNSSFLLFSRFRLLIELKRTFSLLQISEEKFRNFES